MTAVLAARRSAPADAAAPWWLPGGHAQTIWAAVGARQAGGPPLGWRRERWSTPDADFIDVDFLDAEEPAQAC